MSDNFEEGEDYEETVVNTKSHKKQILLTSERFDTFCMMSTRPKAKLIRKFFSYLMHRQRSPEMNKKTKYELLIYKGICMNVQPRKK